MRSFASDNNSGVHKNIMKALQDANIDHAIGYGDDYLTEKAISKFREVFQKDDLDVFFVYNGTGANITGIQSAINSFNSVICPETAHINVDETGAPEKFTSAKFIPIKTIDGKLRPNDIKPFLAVKGDQHHAQPKLISISQVTELGTVYSLDELKNLVEFAHQNELLVHLDGARISNASTYLDVSFAQMITDTGIDIVSFGGTKNGLMFGEALLIFNKEISKYTKFYRKQASQLASKMRYISAQFLEYFDNDLWKLNANNANLMMKKMVSIINKFNLPIVYPVQSNAVFVKLPKDKINPLLDEFFFYIWDEEESVVRWMTSFDTTDEDLINFEKSLEKIFA